MKKLFKYTWAVIALSALTACSSNDSLSDGGQTPVAPTDPNAGKELIDFSGDGSSITRAGFTRAGFSASTKVYMRIRANEEGGSGVRFAEATATATANIPATSPDSHNSLVGEHSDLNYENGQERYWDDAFGRKSKLTVYAFAIPGKTDATLPTWSKDGWAQVNATTNPNWYTGTEYTTVTWNVSNAQSSETMSKEDLAYSNNIKENGKGGRYTHTYDSGTNTWSLANTMGDNQMIWIPKTDDAGETTGKFDQGHLIFNHALAWIEINLKEGAGFNNSVNTDFGWTKNQATANQNITLVGFNTNGTLDVSTGNWDSQSQSNITQLYENNVSGTQTTRKLYAYVVPGTTLYNNSNNVIEFEIDNAKYYVKGSQICDAIRAYYHDDADDTKDGPGVSEPNAATYRNFEKIESGKHYIINLTVSKKSIDRITAAIVNWETVNSNDAEAKNTYPTFTFEDRGLRLVEGDAAEFNIYRAAQRASDYITGETEPNYTWATGYTTDGAATKEWNSTTNEWKTSWYWPDNLTYYHFRAAGIYNGTATTDPAIVLGTNDNFVIKSGLLDGSDSKGYKDYMWGAPFKELEPGNPNSNTNKLTYSTTDGFDNASGTSHQISQAIGTTESVINMLLFHMTSQITVNVSTTTGTDKVTLEKNGGATESDKTKVELLNFLPNGTVLMGNGLVEATSDGRTAAATMKYGTFAEGSGDVADKVSDYTYGIVPQVLTWTSPTAGTIGLRITTPDGNQYVVKDLSTCTATVSTNNLVNPYSLASGSTTNYVINRWYPNWKYTYNIAIKKTGIERITAAVVDWETVTGDLGTIDLEN